MPYTELELPSCRELSLYEIYFIFCGESNCAKVYGQDLCFLPQKQDYIIINSHTCRSIKASITSRRDEFFIRCDS